MRSFSKRLSDPGAIGWILALGLLLRLIFLLVGGKIYYGTGDFFIQGDTPTWFWSFINLLETGTYTLNPAVENGKFFRPPGYSFLFGIFYLLTFKNYLLAAKILVGVQMLMDVVSIWLVKEISRLAMKETGWKNYFFSNAASLLYALYPFAIVWSPVLYAETPSLFFLLMAIYFCSKSPSAKNALLGGLFGGLAALTRLQCIFALPFLAGIYLFNNRLLKEKLKPIFVFSLGIVFTYGLWPARNYFFQHRLLFSQDLNVGSFWSPDYIAFMDYIFAVRTDHTPVYRSLVRSEMPEWPAASFLNARDSVLLDSVSRMCFTCGTGFSYFMNNEGYREKTVLPEENCDAEIASLFRELTEEQKKKNALHYWISVPLKNLEKCFFKFNLYGEKSATVKMISSALFGFRSAFILLGLLGIYIGWKGRLLQKSFLFFVTGYVVTWYIYLSFFYRNMEMRYLLHTDVLLLIPAALVFFRLLYKEHEP